MNSPRRPRGAAEAGLSNGGVWNGGAAVLEVD